jgi:hypothetical protein
MYLGAMAAFPGPATRFMGDANLDRLPFRDPEAGLEPSGLRQRPAPKFG